MAAGSIVIDLLMRTGSFETDTKRAEKRLKEFQKSTKEFGAAIVATTSAAAAGFAFLIKTSIDNMDRLNEMSQMAGVTVENLSALGYAAKTAGVNQEDLTSSLVKLSKGLSEASQGSGDALKAFQALKIDSSQFESADQALMAIAEKFAGLEDGANKTALALALFGKSGAQLIPFLNAGRDGIEELKKEAERLGVVIGSDAAKAADEFNDNVDKLKANLTGLVNIITINLLPALNQFVIGLNNIRDASFKGWFTTSGKEEQNAQATINELERNLAKIKEIQSAHIQWQQDHPFFAVLVEGDVTDLGIQIDYIVSKIEYLKKSLVTVPQVAINWDIDNYGEATPKPKAKAPAMAGDAKEAKESEYEKAIKNLREQISLLGKETEYEKTLELIQIGRYGKLTEGQELSLKLASEQLDIAKENLKYNEEYTKFLDDITGRGDVEEFIKKMNMLSQALYDGSINADKYQEAVGKLSIKFKDETDEMGEFAKQAARNIQDILGSSMEEILTGNFKNIGDSFTSMLNKMISQLASSQLNKLLFGQFDKSGDLGGLFGSVVSGITGLFGGGTNNALGGDYGAYFSEGGYTGDGATMEAAGVVHKGEYVLNASATKRIGIGALNRLNGYASGGYVGSAPPDMGGGSGTVNINIKNEAGGDGYQATATARKNDTGFDIDILVRKALSTDLKNNGQISQQFSNTFGLRRTM